MLSRIACAGALGWGRASGLRDFSPCDRPLEQKDEIDKSPGRDGGEVVWNDANEKSREVLVKLPADMVPAHWDGLYPWIANRLLGIRKIAGWLR